MRIINKLWTAIKDSLFIIIATFIIALVLNYIGADLSDNRIYSKLGRLDIINIFGDKSANGLVTLGFILAIICFIYVLISKEEKSDEK